MSDESPKTDETVTYLAGMMGGVKKGLENVEKQIDRLTSDYNEGREKAQAHAAQVVATLNEKMDRTYFVTEYAPIVKLNQLIKNWTVVLLIGVVVVVLYMALGDRFRATIKPIEDAKKMIPSR